ncbi:VCBS repeat-containing protein [Kocuria aegyptia]|uniref:VCBS repeat-containing protein n=1 Tax=Kocuria aegyptia TaxID=330943 RepID=A0ABP4WGI8_9MICC
MAYSQGWASYSPVALKVADLGRALGWRGDRHLRTLADVNGDGIQDLIGFGNAGVLTARARANITFEAPFLQVPRFGYDDGWTEAGYPRLLGDTNGDGRLDIVGFGHSSTYVALLS